MDCLRMGYLSCLHWKPRKNRGLTRTTSSTFTSSTVPGRRGLRSRDVNGPCIQPFCLDLTTFLWNSLYLFVCLSLEKTVWSVCLMYAEGKGVVKIPLGSIGIAYLQRELFLHSFPTLSLAVAMCIHVTWGRDNNFGDITTKKWWVGESLPSRWQFSSNSSDFPKTEEALWTIDPPWPTSQNWRKHVVTLW